MDKKKLLFQLKYSSPYELLIVNEDRKLEKRTCPFQVMVKDSVGAYRAGDIVEVESVKVDKNLVTVFIIKGKAYYYYSFFIL